MPNKAAWVVAIQSVTRDAARDRLDLMSPQFTVAGWCICAEHQRDFKSVVMRWAEPTTRPVRSQAPAEAVECPQSDQDKGWMYRVKLAPSELAEFVQRLN